MKATNHPLSMDIAPRWEEVSGVRRETARFLGGLGLPRDVIDAVAMVACELTENATKYGSFRDGSQREIGVRVSVGSRDVMVEVRNPVSPAADENLAQLDRMVQWIRGYQDPFEAYLQRLKELSVEGLESTVSRLGLVRIAYEGQSVLDFYVNEENVLAVSAIRRF
ncbi:MAG TPA: ATP-binding protein [Myxococcaceae bacterium]|nr:ATP-binding protein [Myxococcaceae bacterium]